uniref:Cytochrome P450 n=1 Tax=Ascaris lumbricoides TaxID=6252 RepID=A0A0M3IM96_ASCLU
MKRLSVETASQTNMIILLKNESHIYEHPARPTKEIAVSTNHDHHFCLISAIFFSVFVLNRSSCSLTWKSPFYNSSSLQQIGMSQDFFGSRNPTTDSLWEKIEYYRFKRVPFAIINRRFLLNATIRQYL